MAKEHLEAARKCGTKSSWEAFFKEFAGDLGSLGAGDTIRIAELMIQDRDAKFLGQNALSSMIALCRSQKCFDQGLALFEIAAPLGFPLVTLETALLLLEQSKPKEARLLALTALRKRGLPAIVQVKLRLLICNSFAEEGHRHFAKKHFIALENLAESQEIPPGERAHIQVSLARLHFFSGQLTRSSRHYQLATKFALDEGNEELAARSLFNTAAALHNSGHENYEKSYEFARECLALATKNGYSFILAHVESFFGLDAHMIGRLSKAHHHFESALSHLSASDVSFSKVHFLSLLTILCFEEGNFPKALNLAEKTLELSQNDHSDRYQSRYRNIEAHLLWERENFRKAYDVLQDAIKQLRGNGISSNEDYNTWNQYVKYSALLGLKQDLKEPLISPQIRQTSYHISENHIALARIQYNKGDFAGALMNYHRVYQTSLKSDNYNHQLYCLMGIFACRNAQRADSIELEALLESFESCHSLMGRSIHTGYLHFLRASLDFKNKQPKRAAMHLRRSLLSHALPSHYRLIAEIWLKCLRGRRVSFSSPELIQIFEHSTKFFFPVTFTWHAEEGRLSSDLETVLDFKDFPILKDILTCLMEAKAEGLTAPELFTMAWKESLRTQGWRQKLNNALSRLRWHCRGIPFPLIENTQESWRISSSFGLSIPKKPTERLSRQAQILHYSKNRPASAVEIADKLNIPLASVKRVISDLKKSGKLDAMTKGRHILYRPSDSLFGNSVHSESSQD